MNLKEELQEKQKQCEVALKYYENLEVPDYVKEYHKELTIKETKKRLRKIKHLIKKHFKDS